MAEQTATAAASPKRRWSPVRIHPNCGSDRPHRVFGRWRRSLDLLLPDLDQRLRKTYFDTVLGYVWSLFRPLILRGAALRLHPDLPDRR